MKNVEVVQAFLNGESKAKTKNLRIEGDKLINYNTVIAVRKGSDIFLNKQKYSATTSTIQNMVRRVAGVQVKAEVPSESDVIKVLA